MQRGLPFLALLLLAMPGLAAVDPGAREQKLETDGGAISAIAVSPNGNILLGSRDPGSNTPPEATPDVRTWFYLQASGEQRASGSADLANCRTRVLDLCTSHVVSVALDGMGGRFAVASNVAASTDSVRGLVILGSSTGGETHRETFVEPIVAVDFDDDGDTLAVLTAPAVSMVPGSQPQSKVYVLAGFTGGSAPSGLTRLATDPLLDGAPRSLSIGGQGDQVVVGTSAATYRISIPDSGALTATKGAAKAVADVATATAQPMPHAIVGHSDGTIAFYGGAPVNAGTPRFATQPTRAITQVAMDAAATRAAAGDDQGRIFAYRLNITAGSNPFAQPYAPVDIGNAVTLLEMSADGTALLAGDGSAVTLLDLTGNDLRVVWKDTRRHAPYGGISRDGSLAVVAEAPATGTGAATTAVVYESRYRVAMQLPEILPAAVPKTSKEVIVGFANTGNRPTDVELGTGFPRGWFMTASPTQFRLEPGTTQNVTMRFVVPEREPPGDYDLWLNQTLRHPQAPSGATTANKVTVKVPDFNRLVLLDNGPTSLAIVAGGLATFELLAANGGNRDETSRILATITPGWEVRVEPSQVRLSPGQEERVQVTVQAPPALGIGASGRATVSLQNDPTQMVALQATVGAQFRPTLDGPAGMPVPPGNSTTFQLVVGNRGNAADTIRLGFEAATGPVPEGWRFAFLLGQETFEVKLDPGANANVTVVVQTPDAAPDGSALPMVFRATSLADPSKVATERVTFTVTHAEPPVDDGGGRKGPSVGPAAILLVLVVVVVLLVVILGWQRGRT